VRRKLIFLITIILAALFISTLMHAQIRTGNIAGTVKDDTGAILPGATVELQGEKLLGGARSVTTDNRGKFRFPNLMPGDYEITVSLEGFQTIKRGNLHVIVAGTVTVDIILKLSAVEETITVTAESPLVDIKKSGFSTSIESKLFENIPTRRYSVFDIAQTSPGISSGSRKSQWVSASGSSNQSNVFYFEGVEATNVYIGSSWIWANPDQIEEVNVIQVGAPAEYGNFQGMVMNLVSKTGSNEFHGSANLYLQYDWLTGNNTPWAKWPYHRKIYRELTGTFGGYIKKDKIWFFVAGQLMTDRDTGVGANPAYPAKYYMNTMFQRVDWQVTQNNRINVSNDTNWYYWGGTPTAYLPYETTSAQHSWNPLPSVSWTSILSNKTFFEVKYSGWWCNLLTDAVDGDKTTPTRYDWGTGIRHDNYGYWIERHCGSHQVQGTVSHFADDFLKGDHDFKFGAIYNHSYSHLKWGYCSGVAYYDWMDAPYVAYMRLPEDYGGVINRLSAFVDDSWTVNDRLTLNLGVRFDGIRGGFPAYDMLDRYGDPTGEKSKEMMDLIKWNKAAPRLGIAYQLTADRKTVLRLSAGRYYGQLLIINYQAACPSQSTLYGYYYNSATNAYDNLFYSRNPQDNIGINHNLKNPYSDAFSISLEREIIPELSLNATFIYKKSKNDMGVINTSGIYELIDYYDEYGAQTLQLYNQTNSSADNFYYTTNPDDYHDYKGFMLILKKRLTHNWLLNANLTISKARNFPAGYRDPNENINQYGAVGEYDQRYVLKVVGSYFFPHGINVSAYYTYAQGLPFNRTIRVPLNQGTRSIAAEERGSQRYQDRIFFDLRIEKEFPLWKNTRIKLLADIWNLLNRASYRSVVSTLGESPNYLVGTRYDQPRRAQIGLRFIF